MNARRNLAWKLNWWRQSELEGALLLGRMVGAVTDGALAARLTRHSAEEAEHSRLWADVIAALELPHVRIFRSYQSFYLRHSGPPASLLDVLVFTQVFERRVHRRFHEELKRDETPPAAHAAYERMIEDEKDHLAWVAAWLREQPGATERLRAFEDIDERVFAELRPFDGCIPAIPNLGEETPAAFARSALDCGEDRRSSESRTAERRSSPHSTAAAPRSLHEHHDH